ncbi:MAG: class II fumarate hydratase [Acidobacteria bacterium]|nr:class II fumarate hydratase [Acidobacteriota bacterium]
MSKMRSEEDSMGKMEVPADAYYGAQTQRAFLNFPISGRPMPIPFTRAMGLIKLAAARTNHDLGKLDGKLAAAIEASAREVMDGKLTDQFVVDVFQTGSGTSSNMNANEVIANRAIEMLGGKLGSKTPVHPNDHVNMGQSSNDVVPTAIHVAARMEMHEKLIPALTQLRDAFAAKQEEFDDIIKIGRTHLQDATPLRLGQEFGGYRSQMEHALARAHKASKALAELALGGTAVGTGLNTHPEFARKAIDIISEIVGGEFREADDHFEAQATKDACVEASGQLKTIAVSLMKIANDLRWLGSGPRCGLGEIRLPATQPGSSIMPGKINPVIAESVTMVAAQVMGNDTVVALAGMNGNFELNVMMPVLAMNLIESVELLAAVSRNFAEKCVLGIEADAERCQSMVERSLAMVTSLAPRIGYDKAAALAKEAYASGRTVREVAMEKKVLPEDELKQALDPRSMTEPHSE